MKKKSGLAPKRKQIRVIIADDHPIVREGLRALIKSQQDMRVVSEAADGQQAVQQYRLHRPDVLLLDLRMPRMNGMETIQNIIHEDRKAKIIVLSTYDGDEDIFRALKAGAKGYLLKDSPREQLVDAVRSANEGQMAIPAKIGERLATRTAAHSLTERERQVLELMVAGKSNKEIAASIEVTPGTVKVHIGHILKKLSAAGRTDAIRIALERGIVHLNSYSAI